MGRLAGLACVILSVSACGVGASHGSLAARSPSPSPGQASSSPSSSPIAPIPVESSPSPSPLPSPVPAAACHSGGAAGPMVLLKGGYYSPSQLYDVSDPVHPKRLCTISNTSAHLVSADTFEYLKPVSGSETDVMLHSLGSGSESILARLPFYVTDAAWLRDLSVMAYTTPVPVDNDYFFAGGVEVWLYSQGRTASLFKYRTGIGDYICRFGLPPQVLAISPDGQYVAAGWEAGKGSEPLHVYRVADRSLVITLDQQVSSALWDRSGHRLFLNRFGNLPDQAWTPEAGVVTLAGAGAWLVLPGLSPDGSQVAYTNYSDPDVGSQPRVYVYDLNAGKTRMLVDKLRTQVVFIKDGWVWYLEERTCGPAEGCAGGTMPTGKVFATQLSAGSETDVSFAAGESPLIQRENFLDWTTFAPGEFWPAT